MEKGNAVTFSEKELEDMLNDIPVTHSTKGRVYTALEDAFIVQVFERRLNKQKAAKKLGISENTLRSRYRVIIGE